MIAENPDKKWSCEKSGSAQKRSDQENVDSYHYNWLCTRVVIYIQVNRFNRHFTAEWHILASTWLYNFTVLSSALLCYPLRDIGYGRNWFQVDIELLCTSWIHSGLWAMMYCCPECMNHCLTNGLLDWISYQTPASALTTKFCSFLVHSVCQAILLNKVYQNYQIYHCFCTLMLRVKGLRKSYMVLQVVICNWSGNAIPPSECVHGILGFISVLQNTLLFLLSIWLTDILSVWPVTVCWKYLTNNKVFYKYSFWIMTSFQKSVSFCATIKWNGFCFCELGSWNLFKSFGAVHKWRIRYCQQVQHSPVDAYR